MTRASSLGVVLVAIALVCMPAAVHAQCVVVDKPEELFALSATIFLGRVVANEPTGARGDHQIVDIATFQVERSWKGNPARQVRVGGDRLFELGKRYVVFASGKPLSTSLLCREAEPIDSAKAKLEWLSKIRTAG